MSKTLKIVIVVSLLIGWGGVMWISSLDRCEIVVCD